MDATAGKIFTRFTCLRERPAWGWGLAGPGAPPAAPSVSPSSQVLLQTSPYHVDSLLQLSDACRFQEDQEMARDLVGKGARGHPALLFLRTRTRLRWRSTGVV